MSTRKIFFLLIMLFFTMESMGKSEDDTSLLKHSWRYYYKRGTLQFNASMYDYSIESMKKALRKKPDLYQAANTLGTIYVMKNKKSEGLEALELSLGIHPRQPDILYRAALLHEFFAHPEKAFNYLKKSILLDRSHAKSHAHIVRFYYDRGEKKKATDHLALSITIGKKQAAIHYDRARRAEKSRQYKKALTLYRLVLEKSPGWDEAYIRIYEIYRVQKNFTAAVKQLEELIRIVPFHLQGRVALGHLYFSKKISRYRAWNIRQAIIHLEKAAELAPNNPETFHVLSDIYNYIGDDVKGRALKDKAYSLEEMNGTGKK